MGKGKGREGMGWGEAYCAPPTRADMEEMPMMEPPGGDCDDICVAAACTVLNAPVRLASRCLAQSWGVILQKRHQKPTILPAIPPPTQVP